MRSVPPATVPRLDLDWEQRRKNFAESCRALLQGPAPREFLGAPYFRDCWVQARAPRLAFVIALGWHTAFVLLLLVPLWNLIVAGPTVRQHQQIAWYGPVHDFPLMLPASASPAVKARRAATRPDRTLAKLQAPAAPSGADAFHPRQTIVNAPMRPNHPRQTLLQPATPPEPPRILPPLPNIVMESASVPQLRIDPAELARLQPKTPAARSQAEVAAPDVAAQERQLSALNLEPANANIQKPALPVSALPVPRAKALRATQQSASNAAPNAAPNINAGDAGDGALRMIALSAAPAPALPPPIPAGNLSSRVTISPQGEVRGSPASGDKMGPATGPAGLSITGGNADKSSVSALGGKTDGPGTAISGTTTGAPPKIGEGAGRKSPPRSENSPALNSLAQRMRPGVAPEALLGDKRIYTLHVNMPNLTSAAGSWVLSFAELAPPEAQINAYTPPASLAAPEALRKVDPKYPPELRKEHVEGEVVLYAVIRADGSVDSIQLVTGIDPALDSNAMQALAQWKFRPAERKGEPVELEAIVHIPFRATAPAF